MITAERNSESVTRNSSFFKLSPEYPEDIPSDEEEEDDVPKPQPEEIPELPPIEPAQVPQTPAHTPAVRTRPQRNRQAPVKFKDFVMNRVDHSAVLGQNNALLVVQGTAVYPNPDRFS